MKHIQLKRELNTLNFEKNSGLTDAEKRENHP
jgi:hypothetical protein